MHVANVTREDGIACAHLIRALQIARFSDLSQKDMEAFLEAKKWLAGLANSMAGQLRSDSSAPPSTPPPPAAGGMRVTGLGALPKTGEAKMSAGKSKRSKRK